MTSIPQITYPLRLLTVIESQSSKKERRILPSPCNIPTQRKQHINYSPAPNFK